MVLNTETSAIPFFAFLFQECFPISPSSGTFPYSLSLHPFLLSDILHIWHPDHPSIFFPHPITVHKNNHFHTFPSHRQIYLSSEAMTVPQRHLPLQTHNPHHLLLLFFLQTKNDRPVILYLSEFHPHKCCYHPRKTKMSDCKKPPPIFLF